MPLPTIAALHKKYANGKALVRVLNYTEHEHKNKDGSITTVLESLGVEMPVDIMDVRINWGNVQCLIRPVRGTGSTWVTVGRRDRRSRLTLVEDWPDESQADESGLPADDALGSSA